MKIGIIVHSVTGHTYSLAGKLKEKLEASGNSVNIERITPVDSGQADPNKVQIAKLPDISPYDALVLAAPVQAFKVSPVMAAYLKQLPALNGKKVALFVTKGLPFLGTGGNQAIAKMKDACESRGGKVTETGIVVWSGGGLDKRIADVVEKLSKFYL